MKQVEVQIMGQGYMLGCPEGGEARFEQAVNRVDQAMCKIRDAGKIKARDRIAVLAALNLAFDLGDKANAVSPASTDSPTDNTPKLQALLQKLDQALAADSNLI
jgi:cell division protein ZapA